MSPAGNVLGTAQINVNGITVRFEHLGGGQHRFRLIAAQLPGGKGMRRRVRHHLWKDAIHLRPYLGNERPISFTRGKQIGPIGRVADIYDGVDHGRVADMGAIAAGQDPPGQLALNATGEKPKLKHKKQKSLWVGWL